MTRFSDLEETRSAEAVLVATYRRILTIIGVGTVLGAFVELASLRHWTTPFQLVPWFVLGILLVAALAWWLAPTTLTMRILRGAAILAVLGSGFGVYEHIEANLESGPLDARFSATWATMATPAQLWTAASGGVGPSPPLAPGMIGLAGVLLWLATLGWSGRRLDGSDGHDGHD
jgi:hypothetical protein